MNSLVYKDGSEVRVGDVVEVVYGMFNVRKRGVVSYIYDSSRPSVPNGDNERGFSIRLADGSILWSDILHIPEGTILINRESGTINPPPPAEPPLNSP